jgi:hypothetical protein
MSISAVLSPCPDPAYAVYCIWEGVEASETSTFFPVGNLTQMTRECRKEWELLGALAIKKLISGFNISLLIQASLSFTAHYFWTFESKNRNKKRK